MNFVSESVCLSGSCSTSRSSQIVGTRQLQRLRDQSCWKVRVSMADFVADFAQGAAKGGRQRSSITSFRFRDSFALFGHFF